MAKNKTKGGKEIEVVPNGRGYYKVQFTSGGQLPASLTGIFTTPNFAQAAINKYLSNG